APINEWRKPAQRRRWAPFEKGGGYSKWFGHHFWTVDWQHNGARIKARIDPKYNRPYSNVWMLKETEKRFFARKGWTYSYMARGSLGLRALDSGTVFSHLASVIFFCTPLPGGAATVNCRFSSMIVRSISAKIQLNES